MKPPYWLQGCPSIIRQGEPGREVLWHHDANVVARPDESVAELFHLVRISEVDERCCPVYRQQQGTASAVATGRLFLRLRDDLTLDTMESRLKSLGLRVSAPLKWAPNAAWISPADANPCHGLARLPDLIKIDGVVQVEAQLLMQLGRRQSP